MRMPSQHVLIDVPLSKSSCNIRCEHALRRFSHFQWMLFRESAAADDVASVGDTPVTNTEPPRLPPPDMRPLAMPLITLKLLRTLLLPAPTTPAPVRAPFLTLPLFW
mmetsp:Transcript_58256/g.104286  ORF Transcript_58256/g.104286 Transcript_58256/m.104286 type:complete len:107 (+) Transcript_58256:1-321(+)